jgi:hypothetical protein
MVLGSLVVEGKLQRLHGFENDTHGLHGIGEDDLLEGFPFVSRVSTLVYELHLFQDGRFARFTSTCIVHQTCSLCNRGREGQLTEEQHLDLISLRHLVALKLIVDLIVSCLAGIVFLARSATHCGGWCENSRDESGGLSAGQIESKTPVPNQTANPYKSDRVWWCA